MSFVGKTLYNIFRFVVNIGFVFLFQMMFHAENALTAVALSIGLTVPPNGELHIRPGAMCCIVLLLYIGGGIAAQSVLLHPALAFLINFWLLASLLALVSESMEMRANISFLFCFIFSQSTYVLWTQLPAHPACASFGALLICGRIILNWKRESINRSGCTLKEQFRRSRVHRSYILRMSLGISLVMLITSILQPSKPLWINIAVISLTQLEFSETLERIRHRFADTLVDIMLFSAFFQLLISQQYAMLVIMPLGCIGLLLPEYEYKQVINAISTLNAFLVTLDTKTVIENRLFCLVLGIVTVIVIYMLADTAREVQHTQRWSVYTAMVGDRPKDRETVTLLSISACTYGE